MTLRVSALFLLPGLVTVPALRARPVFHDSQVPQISFASAEIARALGQGRATAGRGLCDISSPASQLRFAIAGEAAESNALAQTLHVAPLKATTPQAYAIRLGSIGKTGDSDHSPHIAERGIKFNIPLDRRTPTYSDSSDSAQSNNPEMQVISGWTRI